MHDHSAWLEFEAKNTGAAEDLLDRVLDAGRIPGQWKDIRVDRQDSLDREGGTHVLHGEAKASGRIWRFEIEGGNRRGTVVLGWEDVGDAADFRPAARKGTDARKGTADRPKSPKKGRIDARI